MSADEADPKEEQFTSLMAACDDALAAGKTPKELVAGTLRVPGHRQTESAGYSELQPRLQRNLACVDLLRQVLRRSPAVAAGDITLPSPVAGESVPAPHLPWTSLGRFQIQRELGRGGFGIVFLAYDPLLGREVALKVPHAEVVITPELRERFQREARAAAGLEHPNLVPVYEAGEVGPVCYIVSAYCPGITLTRWLKEQTDPVPFNQAAQLVATLAEAVQHAHSRGVVHRDLKPSNVLLEIQDFHLTRRWDRRLACRDRRDACPTGDAVPEQSLGTGCGDQPFAIPKVTDFGLAKLLSSETDALGGQTRTGAILGTPSYMAPEQAAGKKSTIGPAADVYSLGAILYELLTRRPPFQGESDLETLLQVQSEEPVPPRRLRSRVPRDLETICLKCIQKEPIKRFVSAADLAEDLRRYLAGKPILARPVGKLERLGRWWWNNPGLGTLAASIAVLLGALVVGSIWVALRFEADNARLLDAELDTKKKLFWSFVAQVQAGRRSGLPGRRWKSLEILAEAVRLRKELKELADPETTLVLRNEMISCLALADLKEGPKWPGRPAGSNGIVFDARLALYARAHADGAIRVGRVESDEEVALLKGQPGEIENMRFSPDGRFLAARKKGSGLLLQIWDLEKQPPVLVDLGQISATALDFRPNSHELAVGHPDGTISLYDLETRQRMRHREIGILDRIAFHPEGRQIALMHKDDPTVRICDVEQEIVLDELPHPGILMDMAWSQDGKRLAVACDRDRHIYVWDIAGRNKVGRNKESVKRVVLEGHGGWSTSQLAFYPAGDLLVSAGFDSTLRLWDLTSSRELFRIIVGETTEVRFSPDGQWLTGKFQETEVQRWRVYTGREYRTLVSSIEPERPVGWGTGAISPDGRWLAMTRGDGAFMWNLGSGEETVLEVGARTNAVLFTPGRKETEAKELLTFGRDWSYSGLYRWPIQAPRNSPGRLQIGPPELILPKGGERMSISRDGKTLVVAIGYPGGVVLKLDPLRTLAPSLKHPGAFFTAISPNGLWAAT